MIALAAANAAEGEGALRTQPCLSSSLFCARCGRCDAALIESGFVLLLRRDTVKINCRLICAAARLYSIYFLLSLRVSLADFCQSETVAAAEAVTGSRAERSAIRMSPWRVLKAQITTFEWRSGTWIKGKRWAKKNENS